MCMARSDVGLAQLKYLASFYRWLGWFDKVRVTERLLKHWSR